MTRSLSRALLLPILACFVLTLSVARAAPPAKVDPAVAAATAEAKKSFEVGLKLYKEGLVKEALSAFLAANRLVPRASVQRNIGQCQRDLKDFAAAYDTYADLLEKFGVAMKPQESADVKRAIDELSLLTGAIAIKSTEADATITIDDKEIGKTPLAKPLRMNIGTHSVSVTKAGFEPFSKQAIIAGNDQVTVDATLEREVRTGHLSVVGVGPAEGVTLLIDGRAMGPLPWEGDLEPGSHQVEATGPSSAAPAQRVDIARRQRSELTLQLQAQTGTLYVDPRNAAAEISIDGKVAGKAVWEGALLPGRHELLVTAPAYKPYQRFLVIHVGERAVETPQLQLDENASLHDFRGLYVGIELQGRLGTAATNGIAESCPVRLGSCEYGNQNGAGARLRIGYAFGWLGLEGFGLSTFDAGSANADYQAYQTLAAPPTIFYGRREDYSFNRFGAGAGIGLRATSKHPIIRFTGGMGLAFAFRSMEAKVDAQVEAPPDSSGGNGGTVTENRNWSSSVSKSIPMLLFDAGLLLGSTPGTKFELGALAVVELYGDPVVTEGQAADRVRTVDVPRPGVQVARGTEVFIGPMIGLQFGE